MSRRRSDVWPDNASELFAWAVMLGLIGGQFVWFTGPALAPAVEGTVVGEYVPVVEGEVDELVLSDRDRRYLNRISLEQSTEVVYCGLLDGREMRPWLARLVASSPHGATYSASECPDSPTGGRVNIHTHPGGALTLSDADRRLFDMGYRYVCVQGDEITAAVGERTTAFRCYADADDPTEVPVRIVADG